MYTFSDIGLSMVNIYTINFNFDAISHLHAFARTEGADGGSP